MKNEKTKSDEKDANALVLMGVGVGALGAASAALVGAVCPLCVFVAPGLIGYGSYKRWKLSQVKNGEPNNE